MEDQYLAKVLELGLKLKRDVGQFHPLASDACADTIDREYFDCVLDQIGIPRKGFFRSECDEYCPKNCSGVHEFASDYLYDHCFAVSEDHGLKYAPLAPFVRRASNKPEKVRKDNPMQVAPPMQYSAISDRRAYGNT